MDEKFGFDIAVAVSTVEWLLPMVHERIGMLRMIGILKTGRK